MKWTLTITENGDKPDVLILSDYPEISPFNGGFMRVTGMALGHRVECYISPQTCRMFTIVETTDEEALILLVQRSNMDVAEEAAKTWGITALFEEMKLGILAPKSRRR